MTATTTTDTTAPDPIAEATGSDDPQVQRLVLGAAMGADGRDGLPDAATVESWLETHRALLREAANPDFLQDLMASQLTALHCLGMDGLRAARANGRKIEDCHRDLRLATAALRVGTQLKREIDRLAARRARQAQRRKTTPAA